MPPDDVRAALMAGNFDAAKSLALILGSRAQADLRAAQDPRVRREILNGAIDRLNDALSLARVLRAHLASQLQDNSTRLLYQAEHPNRHRWQFVA